ncbi:GL22504 [Drosophila persimilis]|uniref:GL22504 n=1 Tax=Drosophila persimilis TaxID=7234 RepID=B4H1D0_DROPE|nr:GL22504 [Drosophila persimilis]
MKKMKKKKQPWCHGSMFQLVDSQQRIIPGSKRCPLPAPFRLAAPTATATATATATVTDGVICGTSRGRTLLQSVTSPRFRIPFQETEH